MTDTPPTYESTHPSSPVAPRWRTILAQSQNALFPSSSSDSSISDWEEPRNDNGDTVYFAALKRREEERLTEKRARTRLGFGELLSCWLMLLGTLIDDSDRQGEQESFSPSFVPSPFHTIHPDVSCFPANSSHLLLPSFRPESPPAPNFTAKQLVDIVEAALLETREFVKRYEMVVQGSSPSRETIEDMFKMEVGRRSAGKIGIVSFSFSEERRLTRRVRRIQQGRDSRRTL